MGVTQSFRHIAVSSPLGKDVLLFHSMRATEAMGEAFSFHLELFSERADIQPKELLGHNMTVRLELPDGKTRYFNGYVNQFVRSGREEGLHGYQAVLVPWLWFLRLTTDCRIFQNKSVPDIIKEVFRDAGFTDFEARLNGSYRQLDYCVQFNESAFDFVSRLMEQEGIYYFFRHENGKHYLVLSDSISSHNTEAGYETVPYYPPDQADRRERDHLDRWDMIETVCTGQAAVNDFNFTKPKASMGATHKIPTQHPQSTFEAYRYPGEYTSSGDGAEIARKLIEKVHVQHTQWTGGGDARGLVTGALFTLDKHPVKDQNREYLIIGTTHSLQSNTYGSTGGGAPSTQYHCSLTVIDSKQPFRMTSNTPKPRVSGPQTAIVVGKSGEEIWTDKYGRVKVKFHWDRHNKADENASCWVRVAQVWAGTKFGAMHIPRIGQEVIVDFIDGDIDRPIITGRVYNGDSMPPYALPGNQTQSGIKSRSTKGGAASNFNELRFEDKKGSEEVFMHGEKLITITAKKKIQLLCGKSSVTMTDDGSITIKGVTLKIEGGGGNVTIKGSPLVKIN